MRGTRRNIRPRQDAPGELAQELARLASMDIAQLRSLWQEKHGCAAPAGLTKDLLLRSLCHQLQEERLGPLDKALEKLLAQDASKTKSLTPRVKLGSRIVREHQGFVHEVVVVPEGFLWQGETYSSLSIIAHKITGTVWSGPRFFGLRRKTRNGNKP